MARGFVNHLDLNVSDPAASIPFYARVLEYLGYTRQWVDPPDGRADLDACERSDRCAWWLRDAAGFYFGIEVRPPAEPSPRDTHERYSPGIDHLALHADDRADVDRLYDILIAAGILVADPPAEYDYEPGYYAVAFDDPDGIRLEVVHDPVANP